MYINTYIYIYILEGDNLLYFLKESLGLVCQHLMIAYQSQRMQLWISHSASGERG